MSPSVFIKTQQSSMIWQQRVPLKERRDQKQNQKKEGEKKNPLYVVAGLVAWPTYRWCSLYVT